MPKQTLVQLLAACTASNESEDWREFDRRVRRRLAAGVNRASRRSGLGARPEWVEEMIQEIYYRLLDRDCRNLRSCRGTRDGEVGSYLARVAESITIDCLRAAAAEKRGGDLIVDIAPGDERSPVDLVRDRAPSPEDRILTRERRHALARHCRQVVRPQLARRDLEIFYLAMFEGLDSKEICARLGRGLTPTGVDSVVHRMRKRLRARGFHIPRR